MRLSRSGVQRGGTLHPRAVPEDDQSGGLLDALSGAGIDVASGCQRRECGLCAVQRVGVEEEVDHRDPFLSDNQKGEHDLICACVSRALGSVTIDTGHREYL